MSKHESHFADDARTLHEIAERFTDLIMYAERGKITPELARRADNWCKQLRIIANRMPP